MAGVVGRSGGHNRLSMEQHRLAGTWRPDRHADRPAADKDRPSQDVSRADRKALLDGLPAVGRAIVVKLVSRYHGWDEAGLATLRSYAWACARLHDLEQDPAADPRAVRAETRTAVLLLRALDLPRK